jgi:hypothetical protein
MLKSLACSDEATLHPEALIATAWLKWSPPTS